jgi:hypothetical protein
MGACRVALVGLSLLLGAIAVTIVSVMPRRLEFTIANIRHNAWYAFQGFGAHAVLYAVPIYGLLLLVSCMRS